MNNLTINNFHMASQILQQYRDLTARGNKLFYYSYAKLDCKIQAILKAEGLELSESNVLTNNDNLTVDISYDEIKELFNIEKLQKRDMNKMIKDITEKSHITIATEDKSKTKIIFIYKSICIDSNERKISFEFNENVLELFEYIRVQGNSFVDIKFDEIIALNTKYEINLYLYCLTILRGNKGNVSMSIDNLREILAGKDNFSNDLNFLTRFINRPSQLITNNENINMSIYHNKINKNTINLKVERKKEEEKKISEKRKEKEPF